MVQVFTAQRRRFVQAVAAIAALTAFTGIQAAGKETGKETIAVLSLAGDQLSSVRYQPSVGSALDRNAKQAINVNGMDAAIARAIAEGLRKAQPGVSAIPFETRDAALLASEDPKAAIAALRPELEKAGATQAIVVTKQRRDARIKVGQGHVGAGKLSGLGFYEDHAEQGPSRHDELSQGYFAAFVYAKVWLVDLASNEMHELPVAESKLWTVMDLPGSVDPWTVLSPAARVQDLRELAQRSLGDAAVALVAHQGL